MTDKPNLADARRVAEAATQGPWYWEPPSDESYPDGDESLRSSGVKDDGTTYNGGVSYDKVVLSGRGYDASGTTASDEDREFIAASRTLVPAMEQALRDVLASRPNHAAVCRCGACSQHKRTVRAITAHLDIEEQR